LDTRTDAKGVKQPARKKSASAPRAERNRKARERREEKRKQKWEAALQAREAKEAEIEQAAKAVAHRLIERAPDIAREIHGFTDDHWWPFVEALRRELRSDDEWNAALKEAGAVEINGTLGADHCLVPMIEARAEEIIKKKRTTAADDGSDPGPIPESLRRRAP
jgi:hypothetical protein